MPKNCSKLQKTSFTFHCPKPLQSGKAASETSSPEHRGLQRLLPGQRTVLKHRDGVLRGRRHEQPHSTVQGQTVYRDSGHGLVCAN